MKVVRRVIPVRQTALPPAIEAAGRPDDDTVTHRDPMDLRPRSRQQVDEELDNALAAIEDAEDEFAKSNRRIHSVRPQEAAQEATAEAQDELLEHSHPVVGTDDFPTWFRRGFAFNIPLVAGLIVLLILARLMF